MIFLEYFDLQMGICNCWGGSCKRCYSCRGWSTQHISLVYCVPFAAIRNQSLVFTHLYLQNSCKPTYVGPISLSTRSLFLLLLINNLIFRLPAGSLLANALEREAWLDIKSRILTSTSHIVFSLFIVSIVLFK